MRDHVLFLESGLARKDRGANGPRLAKSPTYLIDADYCGHHVDVDVQYNGGFSSAQAYAGLYVEPDGFLPWEGSFYIYASASKYVSDPQSPFYFDDDDNGGNPVVSGAGVDAVAPDTFGGGSCTMEASAIIAAFGSPDCFDSWQDEGPCV